MRETEPVLLKERKYREPGLPEIRGQAEVRGPPSDSWLRDHIPMAVIQEAVVANDASPLTDPRWSPAITFTSN